MRGRKIFREPLNPNLTPPWVDPPEPPPECEFCEGEGVVAHDVGKYLDERPVSLCSQCGGTGEKP